MERALAKQYLWGSWDNGQRESERVSSESTEYGASNPRQSVNG